MNGGVLKYYRFTCQVEAAHGHQSWVVAANNQQEAKKNFESGKEAFEFEEVEVTELSQPYIEELTGENAEAAKELLEKRSR